MNYRQISDEIAVSPQIDPQDVAEIKSAGYNSIICNRPDHEDHGQATFMEIEAAALASGLPILNVPVISGQITLENVRDMKKALAELPKPVFAYCRSGARCTNLYAMVQQLDD